MTNTPIPTPAGWFPAPDGSSAMWWWDGARWIEPHHETGPNPGATRALTGLAKATQVLLISYGVVTLATIAVETFGISAATRFLEGADVTTDSLVAYDQGTSVVSILSSLSLIATAVLWVIWQYQAAKQVAGLTRRSAGWHVGSWFVPIISLWYPYQNISDLWRAVGRARPWWHVCWWLLWIASNAVVGQSTRLYLAAVDLEQVRFAMWMSNAGAILTLAAVPFAYLIIRGITQGILQRSSTPVPPTLV